MAGRRTPKDKEAPAEAPEAEADTAKTPEAGAAEAAPDADSKANTVPEEAAEAPAEEAAEDVLTLEGPVVEEGVEEAPAPEPEPETRPAPEPESPPAPAPTVVKRGPGFVPLVLGGIVAAAIGYGGSRYLPSDWLPFGPKAAKTADETAALKAQLAEQAKALEALKTQIAQTSKEAAGLPGQIDTVNNDLGGRIDDQKKALSAGIETNTLAIADLKQGLAKVASAPAVAPTEGAPAAVPPDVTKKLAALGQRVTKLEAGEKTLNQAVQSRIDAAEKAAAEARQKAAAEAKTASARAALTRIEAALAAGGPYAEATSALTDAGVTVPPALSGPAEAGVPTLAALRQGFAPAARKALAVSVKEKMGGGTWGRITAFLQVQTGARSLTPREGDGPDAVLSRAQASVDKGDISAAIETIKALPEPGQKAMAAWVAEAGTRLKAEAAAKTLATTLNGK